MLTVLYTIDIDSKSIALILFKVAVEFEQAVYTVMEDIGSLRACALVTGDPGDIHISLFTVRDTAQGGIATSIIYIHSLLKHVSIPKADLNYVHTETNTSSRPNERLCLEIPIIDNFLPGSAVQFSLRATSRSHTISAVNSTVVIMDDGMSLTIHHCF